MRAPAAQTRRPGAGALARWALSRFETQLGAIQPRLCVYAKRFDQIQKRPLDFRGFQSLLLRWRRAHLKHDLRRIDGVNVPIIQQAVIAIKPMSMHAATQTSPETRYSQRHGQHAGRHHRRRHLGHRHGHPAPGARRARRRDGESAAWRTFIIGILLPPGWSGLGAAD